MSLFKTHLEHPVDPLALHSVKITGTQARTVFLQCMYFLCKILHSLCALRNTRQRFSMTLGNNFKQQDHQHKPQTRENVALKRPWKGCLFTVWVKRNKCGKQEGRGLPCSDLSWEHTQWQINSCAALWSVNDSESAVCVDSGVSNKF